MAGNLSGRVAKLVAQATAHDAQEWWRTPGAVEQAQRGAKRKLAAVIWQAHLDVNTPEQLTASFVADYPGWPDAFDEDERTEIILKELFHSNPALKADVHRFLKERVRGEGLT